MTRVTVLMPVYNAMPFLPAAVESVLTQTLSDFELLIIDDGSSDGSCAYLEKLEDRRIRIVKRTHEGLGATLNAGLGLCNSEFVARMDGDDLIHPRRLQAQMEYLIDHAHVSMVGCQVEFLVGKPTGLVSRVPLLHSDIVARLLTAKSGISHATLMMRSTVAQSIGGYRIAGAGEDLDFCLRICEAGQAANLAEVYYYYRLLPRSISPARRSEIRLGYAYAIESANCRRRGAPEPTFETFRTQWEHRHALQELLDVLEDWATCQFRLSVIDRAEKKKLRGLVRLLTAAAAQPHWCGWHLQQMAKRWIADVNRPGAIAKRVN